MLFDAQQIGELHEYIDASADPELLRWWAQYAESNQRFREAKQYYERAKDHLAIVRVYCFHNQFDRAAKIVEASRRPRRGVPPREAVRDRGGHPEGDQVLPARAALQPRDPARAPARPRGGAQPERPINGAAQADDGGGGALRGARAGGARGDALRQGRPPRQGDRPLLPRRRASSTSCARSPSSCRPTPTPRCSTAAPSTSSTTGRTRRRCASSRSRASARRRSTSA